MKKLGAEVLITVDGKRTTEYYAVEEGDVVSCHIASEAGKEFSVKMTNQFDGDMRCHLSVDGVKVGKRYLVPQQSKRIKGIDSEDGLSYKPFKFASLRTTDDETALAASRQKNQQELGTIRMECFRATKVQRPGVNGRQGKAKHDKKAKPAAAPILNNSPVHEKTKKLGGHVTELGQAVAYPCQSVKVSKVSNEMTKLLDPSDAPYITFVWHYLPQDVLQARDIMPREVSQRAHSPSPPIAGPSNRPVVDNRGMGAVNKASDAGVTKQEAPEGGITAMEVEVAQMEAALAAKRAALESQRQLSQHQGGVKRERSPIRLAKALHGDVIDLTLDD